MKKVKHCPFIWTWDTRIHKNGDVTVIFKEVKLSTLLAREYENTIYFEFSRAEIISWIRKHTTGNKFYQINFEGYLDDSIHEVMDTIRNQRSVNDRNEYEKVTGITYTLETGTELIKTPFDKKRSVKSAIEDAAKKTAILAVFRSTIRYESPYSGNTNCPFDIPRYLRTTGTFELH